MRYTQRNILGGVGALRESDDTNFMKPNGQSRNLNIYVINRTNWPMAQNSACSSLPPSDDHLHQENPPA